MRGIVGRHVTAAGLEQPASPAGVPVTGMVDGHGRLNQSLIKPPVRPGTLVPEVLPDLVSLEILPPVEVLDPGQVARVVFRRRRHAGILNAGGACSSHITPTTPWRAGRGRSATDTGPGCRLSKCSRS